MKFLILALCVAYTVATPLTAGQAQLVKDSWAHVKNHEVDLLYTIFKAYPDIQAKFPQFVGKDLEELKGTAEFATHAGRIIGFLTEVVDLSGSEATRERMITIVTEMAHKHKTRGVTKEQFGNFKTALISYISTHVTWGDDVAAAWNQGIDNMYAVVFKVLDS